LIHRGFIGGGYDDTRNVADEEEQRMTAETGPSPAADSEEQSRRVPRWVMIVAALVLVGVVGVIVYGYLARPGWIGVADKTFWDYLELLIVPAALALGVYWLNRRQDERDREADAARERERQAQAARREEEREADATQREHERQISEDARKQRELEVANQRAQDDALRAQLNQMSSLLLKYDLHSSTEGISAKDISVEDSTARMVARAQTLSVLPMLDGHRKYSVVLFLAESALISKERHIVWLVGADLSNLEVASRSNLRWNLGGTVLHGTDLSGADLHNVFLRKSTLSNTDLSGADLSNADLARRYRVLLGQPSVRKG
jgi:hypothetical protein